MSSTGDRSISCTYLIASHTQLQGVARLARILSYESPAGCVFVHHDAKAGNIPSTLFDGIENVHVVHDPVAAEWGTFSLVDLVLRSLRQIWQTGKASDWVVFLSGQHYPTRPLRDFESMLATSNADAFMTFEPITKSDRHLNDRYRFAYRQFLKGHMPRLLRARQLYDTFLNRAQPFFRIQSDRRGSFLGWRATETIFDREVQVYFGSQWWAMSRAAAEYVMEKCETDPEFVKCYAKSLIPDESFFQTLVVNSPELVAKNMELHFSKWQLHSSSPSFLDISDLDSIRDSQQWFARKVNFSNDGGLCDALDTLRKSAAFEKAN